jgi:dienelactone hydrolase
LAFFGALAVYQFSFFVIATAIMDFSSELNERGVRERRFDLEVGDAVVPGLLWTPDGASGPRPVVLIGHGGTQHKRIDNVLAIARRLVRHLGFAAVAIDAPDHGDRISPERAEAARRALQPRVGQPLTPLSADRLKRMSENTARAVSEWKAVLDEVEKLDDVAGGPVGYWGVSMGTAFGVPFVASEPRVRAAVFGLAGMRPGIDAFAQAASKIAIPLLFMFQLNDELVSPELGLALFSTFASKVKSMHINPGPHVGIPAFEREYYETFFKRHLHASSPAIES